MRKKIVIRRVIQRPFIGTRVRPFYTPVIDFINWRSIPSWIQFFIILLIIGGIFGGIYYGVSSNYEYEEHTEVTIINDTPWWSNSFFPF
mgnify:CR=1 FL=1